MSFKDIAVKAGWGLVGAAAIGSIGYLGKKVYNSLKEDKASNSSSPKEDLVSETQKAEETKSEEVKAPEATVAEEPQAEVKPEVPEVTEVKEAAVVVKEDPVAKDNLSEEPPKESDTKVEDSLKKVEDAGNPEPSIEQLREQVQKLALMESQLQEKLVDLEAEKKGLRDEFASVAAEVIENEVKARLQNQQKKHYHRYPRAGSHKRYQKPQVKPDVEEVFVRAAKPSNSKPETSSEVTQPKKKYYGQRNTIADALGESKVIELKRAVSDISQTNQEEIDKFVKSIDSVAINIDEMNHNGVAKSVH